MIAVAPIKWHPGGFLRIYEALSHTASHFTRRTSVGETYAQREELICTRLLRGADGALKPRAVGPPNPTIVTTYTSF